MGEIDSIVGIYGAADRAVWRDREARARVAQVLPHYADRNLRWFDEFEAWLKRSRGQADGEPLFPSPHEAFSQLRETAPRCRMRARRLFAVAVAIRALPELREESELRNLAIQALSSDELAQREDTAEQLYELLGDDTRLMRADGMNTHGANEWWRDTVVTAHARSWIPSVNGILRRPCSGTLVKAVGVDGPVAALTTDYVTEDVDFDHATRFIDPENWKKCMPWFWCEMLPSGAGMRPGEKRYREVVSSDCKRRERAGFYAETDLLFSFTWLPDEQHPEVALTNYQLCDGRPFAGDLVRVDEGTLVVAKVGPGQRPLRVTTTKRIQFSHGFSARQIAMIMCALGYANVSDDLLCCAANLGGDPDEGRAFEGVSPSVPDQGARRANAGWRRRPPARPRVAHRAAGAPASEGEDSVGELVDEAVEIWARSVRRGLGWLERGAADRRAGTRGRRRDRSGG
jgi:hypothetical protein